jgi:hypothetical protein
VVADRKQRAVGGVKIGDQFHVAENGGIAGVIDRESAGQADDVAAGFAAVNDLIAVLNAAGVEGVRHRDFDLADRLRAAFVHAADICHALRFEPQGRLVNGDDLRLEPLAESDGVADVVEVAVGDEHHVEAVEFLERLGTRGIRVNPGIDDDDFAARSGDSKSRVAEPRQFSSSSLQHEGLPPVEAL